MSDDAPKPPERYRFDVGPHGTCTECDAGRVPVVLLGPEYQASLCVTCMRRAHAEIEEYSADAAPAFISWVAEQLGTFNDIADAPTLAGLAFQVSSEAANVLLGSLLARFDAAAGRVAVDDMIAMIRDPNRNEFTKARRRGPS